MKKLIPLCLLATTALIAACVTINVYFPAASAEKAAQRFVDDVLGEDYEDSALTPEQSPEQGALLLALGTLLDTMVPSAHAQEPELEIDTPQINAIKERMAQRQRSDLNALFDAGAIGFSNDGLIVVRDRSAVPLSDRRKIEGLVADENRDRRAVYREIAVANGHPEWEQQVQETFARRWVSSARAGWFYQDSSGQWRQK